MKKILLICVLFIALLLCSCGTAVQTEEVSKNSKNSMFILLEHNTSIGYDIVYHRDTKVMYAVSNGHYNHGTFTVMLDVDGTPMLYGGAE